MTAAGLRRPQALRPPSRTDGQVVGGTMRAGPRPVLDAVSRAIIEQLQQDGRRSYARIAGAVGLSDTAVPQRVQRLLAPG